MRLTLRTLLAYLDDTLEPSEIKHIGQKIAESEPAREVIARIKQVTRKRRITTPPLSGPGARFDSNTVAEYLDNELPAEQVNELEKTCLESEVHLAEVASCHQILTLVLGEPALVPPTAKERMYGIAKGREAIASRKAPHSGITTVPGSHNVKEPAEAPLLGFSMLHRSTWIWWLLPIAAVLLIACLGLALWMALPGQPTPYASNDSGRQKPGTEGTNPPPPTEKDQSKGSDSEKSKGSGNELPKTGDQTTPPETKRPPETPVTQPVTNPETPPSRPRPALAKPLNDRVYAGQMILPSDRRSPGVLLVRDNPTDQFKRVVPDQPERSRILTNQTVLCLPGYTTDIQCPGGLAVILRGNLPDFAIHPVMELLQDVEIMLHKPAAMIDVDATLERGRIFLTNTNDKKDVVVRLRFLDQQWDLFLKERAEVGVDLVKMYTSDVDLYTEEPRTEVKLCILAGKVEITVNGNHDIKMPAIPGRPAMPTTTISAPAMIQWDSHTAQVPAPELLGGVPPIWSKESPLKPLEAQWDGLQKAFEKTNPEADPARFQQIKALLTYTQGHIDRTKALLPALEEMRGLLSNEARAIDITLLEQTGDKNTDHRYLAMLDLCAIGDVEKLVAALNDEDPMHVPEREFAVFLLKRYMSRGRAASQLLFHDDGKKPTGLLVNKYGDRDARQVFELLHDSRPKELSAEGYLEMELKQLPKFLKSDRLAVRHLAYAQLVRLTAGMKVPPYDPAGPKIERDAAANQWIDFGDQYKGAAKPAPPKP